MAPKEMPFTKLTCKQINIKRTALQPRMYIICMGAQVSIKSIKFRLVRFNFFPNSKSTWNGNACTIYFVFFISTPIKFSQIWTLIIFNVLWLMSEILVALLAVNFQHFIFLTKNQVISSSTDNEIVGEARSQYENDKSVIRWNTVSDFSNWIWK